MSVIFYDVVYDMKLNRIFGGTPVEVREYLGLNPGSAPYWQVCVGVTGVYMPVPQYLLVKP